MKVLVVEDRRRLAEAVAQGLRREGMAVDVSVEGGDALTHLAVNRYDVVVLDRDLPGVHGDQVCRRLIRERSETRVLMLTAASTISDRVEGLELHRTVAGKAGRTAADRDRPRSGVSGLMATVASRVAPAAWLRLPARSARLRLTLMYSGLFLLLGSAVVAITFVLV